MEKLKKKQSGITIITLVVTIIILLILAGVTIALLTGENGILNKATNASKKTDMQTATEIINLKITNTQIAIYSEKQRMPTLQELADNLCDDNEIEYVITKDKETASRLPHIDTTGYTSIFTKLNDYPYEFEIDETLKLATIDENIVDDNTSNGNANTNITNNEELIAKFQEMEIAIKTAQAEIQTLKTNNQELTNKIENLNGKSYSPTGTVISYMGNNAPNGYLKCDGTTYKITDYQNLAEQIKTEFGKYNYYGGNGTTTFAVPDLRGEFLRGTGTNSHTNQGNGSNVGQHQNEGLPNITGKIFDIESLSVAGAFSKPYISDQHVGVGNGISTFGDITFSASQSNPIYGSSDNVTPTNTSVLYCIKY